MRMHPFQRHPIAAQREFTPIIDQGWLVLTLLEGSLLKTEDTAEAAAIRSAMKCVAATMKVAYQVTSKSGSRTARARLRACSADIELCLGDLSLPKPARRDLAGFFGNLLNLQLVIDGVPPMEFGPTAPDIPAQPKSP